MNKDQQTNIKNDLEEIMHYNFEDSLQYARWFIQTKDSEEIRIDSKGVMSYKGEDGDFTPINIEYIAGLEMDFHSDASDAIRLHKVNEDKGMLEARCLIQLEGKLIDKGLFMMVRGNYNGEVIMIATSEIKIVTRPQ